MDDKSSGESETTDGFGHQADRSGDHALYLACDTGHTEAVRLLLARGADPNHRNKYGHAPLGAACLKGFPEIAHLLVNAGITVGVVEAAYLGDLPLLKRLLDEGADIETQDAGQVTPLMAASACGHVEVVRVLLERGADIDFERENGLSALGWAVSRDHAPVIHLLIDHGADPNAVSGPFGSTLLMSAAQFGNLHSVEALLARGADPNLAGQDRKGNGINGDALNKCAFMASASGYFKSETMTRITAVLLDAGADIEARDSVGKTPLMWAASGENTEMVRLLLSRGADVRASTQDGFPTVLSCAQEKNGLNDRHDRSEIVTLIMEALGSEYAVYDAAKYGDVQRLRVLLDAGAPADQGIFLNERMARMEQPTGQTMEEIPLVTAVWEGHAEVVRLLLARPEIRPSSKNKALQQVEDKDLQRLLRWVHHEGHEEAVGLLREAGAVNNGREQGRAKKNPTRDGRQGI